MKKEDLLKIFEEQGIRYKRSGSDAVIKCPNPEHDDKHPSCRVALDKEAFHCFSCGCKGNWVYLISLILGLAPYPTKKYLKDRKIDITDFDILPEVADTTYFTANIYRAYEHPLTEKAVKYLEGRGISKVIAEQFNLGYRNGNILIPVYDNYFFKGCQERNITAKSGSGRYISSFGLKKEDSIFNYISSIHKRVVVVEAPFSAMFLFQQNIHAEAIMGTQVTDEQISKLKRHAKILLWMDNDKSGNLARDRLINELFSYCDVEYVEWEDKYPPKCSPDNIRPENVLHDLNRMRRKSIDDLIM